MAPARTAGPAKKGGARPAAESAGPADDDDSALSRDTLDREEAEAKLAELFGDDLLKELRSSKWKSRLEAMDSMLTKVYPTP